MSALVRTCANGKNWVDLIAEAQNDPALSMLLGALDTEHGRSVLAQLIDTRSDLQSIGYFGSARLTPDHPEYVRMEKLSAAVTEARPGILTVQGGCGGVMEAVGKGARSAAGTVLGCVMHNDTYAEGKGFEKTGWGIHSHQTDVLRFTDYWARMRFMVEEPRAIVVSTSMGGGSAEEASLGYRLMQYGIKRPFIVYGDAKAGGKYLEMIEAMREEKLVSDSHGVADAASGKPGLVARARTPEEVENILRAHHV